MSVATESIRGLGLSRHDIAGRGMQIMQPRAGVVFEPGSAVVHRDGVQLAEIPLSSAPRTDLVTVGRFLGDSTFTASSTADANGGALNPDGSPQCITAYPLSEVGTGWFASGTGENQLVEAMIDRPTFWFDDNTLYASDLNGTLSYAGHLAAVDPTTGRVALKSGELWRVLYEFFSAGQGPGAAARTSDDTVRTVATSLPAGTFAGGVLTLTATGAFSTAQDGVTLAVGDKFIIPAGTITTLVVSAANSGEYEVSSLGATGVSATFTRPANWAHGAIITPETKLRVSGEPTLFSNTVWTAGPATATKIVGTDDPALYPDRVVQSVSLGGGSPTGTVTISNVPIRSATKSFPGITRTTATTPTLTVEYATTSITPGGIGTAAVVLIAAVAAGTINVADGSTLAVIVEN